ncbi:PEP-CTERM sorting domain-containing protein [Edaphobacter bradus]|uniref:PEP-CTERM sorting domain-containing protein n=1 Tax=Edaphobacter bradus TaxID=2259016 RepID=UPI0021E0DBDB|nr:PEP-CTERM sorting domain-containing protein [Edaphobacter bradus]
MRKQILAFGILVLCGMAVAHATTLTPGSTVAASTLSFGGAPVQFLGGPMVSNGITSNYASTAYSDPSNVYCSGCLDFVYQIDPTGGKGSVTDVVQSNFDHFLTSVGFSAQPGQAVPTSISRSADGSLIDFFFANGDPINTFSAFLVVETNVTNFSRVGTIGLVPQTAGTALDIEPMPEPASFVLLGSGLIGLAGLAKRKLLG